MWHVTRTGINFTPEPSHPASCKILLILKEARAGRGTLWWRVGKKTPAESKGPGRWETVTGSTSMEGNPAGKNPQNCFQATESSRLPGKFKLLLYEPDLLSFPLQSLPGLESRESQASKRKIHFHSKVAKNEYHGIC